MKPNPYLKFMLMLGISFLVMYSVMFLNVASLAHIHLSLTRTYMTLLMIAPMAFLGHALGDLARHATPLVRGALGIVSARPAAMPRRQVVALIHATTHCSAFLPFFWSELRRGGIRGL